MTDKEGFCHWSYPIDDKKKNKSEKAACRTVPEDYIEGTWKYNKKPHKKSTLGLCRYDCMDQ